MSSTPGALSFTGFLYRYADTADLNVVHGGRIEFYLKMGPVIYNDDAPESTCKPSFGGDVTLSYSTDQGSTWNVVNTYTPYQYRGHSFTFVEETIPIDAWTNETRFRWRQPQFDPAREYWAIDDVLVYASFDPQWQDSRDYSIEKERRDESIRSKQCCAGTEQCPRSVRSDSCTLGSGIEGRGRTNIHTAETFILVALATANIKQLFVFISKCIEGRSQEIQHRVLPDVSKLSKPFPKQTFCVVEQSWWVCINTVMLISPLVAAIAFSAYSFITHGCGVQSVVMLCISLLFDSVYVAQLLSKSFRVSFCRASRLCVTVDTTPDSGFLSYGRERVPLGSLMDMHLLSSCYVWFLYVFTLVSGLPFATACYMATRISLGLDVHRIYVRFLGACLVARALFGANFLTKLLLASQWIFALSRDQRDEMGRSIKRRGTVRITLYVAASTIFLAAVLVVIYEDRIHPSHARLILYGSIGVGFLLGALVAMLRGLPVNPHIFFTRYPTMGYAVVYDKRAKCPCLFTCSSCSDLHSSQRIFMAYLDDKDLAFVRLLRGDGGSEDQGDTDRLRAEI